MRRGPGISRRLSSSILPRTPDREFTISELADIAYPGVPIEKKHRVATARAVKKLAPSG